MTNITDSVITLYAICDYRTEVICVNPGETIKGLTDEAKLKLGFLGNSVKFVLQENCVNWKVQGF